MKSFIDETTDLSFLTLYGSQLGQAQSIAESILDASSEYKLKTKVFALNDVKNIEDLTKLQCPIVIITSTTGDGEPPENADRFWRKIRRKVLKPNTLQSVRYTLLGLGDTNFNNFCNCGKVLNKRFQELGATSIYSPAWADDAVGQDTVIEDWIEGLWDVLETHCDTKSLTNEIDCEQSGVFISQAMGDTAETPVKLTLPPCPKVSLEIKYLESKDSLPKIDLLDPPAPYPLIDGSPIQGKLTAARCLTKKDSIKTTMEVTIEFLKDRFDFEPGDAIGIVCPNPEDEVNKILSRLNAEELANTAFNVELVSGSKGKFPAHLPVETTLRQCLTHYIDIRTPPKKAFIRLLAENASDEGEKQKLLELCSRQGAKQFEDTIRLPGLSLLDLLLEFSSVSLKPETILEHLPRLIPRIYSVSSSPLTSKTSFTIAFNILVFPKEDGRHYSRLGVCTGWLLKQAKRHVPEDSSTIDDIVDSLKDLQIDQDFPPIAIFKRKNHNFRLPSDVKAPIVMIGPGAGIAPFIGFLEHRCKQKSDNEIGKMTLYFGCRHKLRDFLYEDVLTNLLTDGTLTTLHVSFSRDEDQKGIRYVQDRIEENKEELVSTLFDEGGFLYVCGDAKNMAKNVREKLSLCIQNVKGVSEKEAGELITNLVASKRYLQDVWS